MNKGRKGKFPCHSQLNNSDPVAINIIFRGHMQCVQSVQQGWSDAFIITNSGHTQTILSGTDGKETAVGKTALLHVRRK